MNEWLQHPAVQGVVVPFVTAAVTTLALVRTRWIVLGVAAGLAALLALTIGFALEPLTAVRKLVLAAFATVLLSAVLDARGGATPRRGDALCAGASALAALWLLQRVLAQKDGAAWGLSALGTAAFVGLMVAPALRHLREPLRAAAAGTALGWGSGALAILGASALLGQIGLAVGSACAAVTLVLLWRRPAVASGSTFIWPVAAASAGVGVLACATGELHWSALVPLLFVVPAVSLVPARPERAGRDTLLAGLAGLMPVLAALLWARWGVTALGLAS